MYCCQCACTPSLLCQCHTYEDFVWLISVAPLSRLNLISRTHYFTVMCVKENDTQVNSFNPSFFVFLVLAFLNVYFSVFVYILVYLCVGSSVLKNLILRNKHRNVLRSCLLQVCSAGRCLWSLVEVFQHVMGYTGYIVLFAF